jgi:hypothetical protein
MDKVVFNVRGIMIQIDRKILTDSCLNSILKDVIEFSSTFATTPRDNLCIDEDPAIFHHIINCHKYNLISRPLFVGNDLWEKIADYYCLSDSNKSKVNQNKSYSAEDYYNYFTQLIVKDGKFTPYDYSNTLYGTVVVDKKSLFKCMNHKYKVCIINNEVFLPISYNYEQTYFYCNENKRYIEHISYHFITDRCYEIYNDRYKDKLLALIKSLKHEGFVENKALEEAFIRSISDENKLSTDNTSCSSDGNKSCSCCT